MRERKNDLRFRLEKRILGRLRQGLLTPELTAYFKSEVARLMNAESAKANRKDLTLEVDLAKVRRAIARLLDILESEVGSDALVERLQAKVKEAQLLGAAIIARDKSSKSPPSVVTPDLEMVYDGLFE